MSEHQKGDKAEPRLPLSRLVEAAAQGTAASLRLLATNFRLARNFQQTIRIPRESETDGGTAFDEEGRSVVEIERDGRIGIDLKFGSITFKEEETGTFAVALVDVIVAAADMAPESDTRVQMNVRIAADPEKDSILCVTEAFRSHIVKTLRAAADTLDEASARTLLFYQPEAA